MTPESNTARAMLFFGLGDLVYSAARRPARSASLPDGAVLVVTRPSPCTLGHRLARIFRRRDPMGRARGCSPCRFYNFAHSLRTGSISINAPIFSSELRPHRRARGSFSGEPLTQYKSRVSPSRSPRLAAARRAGSRDAPAA